MRAAETTFGESGRLAGGPRSGDSRTRPMRCGFEREDVPDASDEQLVERFQLGGADSEACFTELVTRHRHWVLSLCRSYSRSAEQDAEDLAQDVFTKVFQALDRFERRSRFKTWLWRIAVNHCLNQNDRRLHRRNVSLPYDPVYDEMRPALLALAEVGAWAERDHIASALAEMTSTLRVPLLLKEREGLSLEEIASRLGIGLSAAKMRLSRARLQFRGHWQRLSEPQTPGSVHA